MADAKGAYRDTLFLPETDFPMRAGLPQREPEHLKRWEAIDLYARQREDAAARGAERFILHDGPPYANGHLHTGHALNKILKDIIVRSHQMMGFDANYVPGWDCHGLPIEWKVEEAFRAKGKAKRDVPTEAFRRECRTYAEKWVEIQGEEFRRLGVIGDWKRPYTTMAFAAEAAIVAEFLKFSTSGQLYRGSKPVMWSPVEQTALAEAEVEYRDHKSTQIWVKFPVTGFGDGRETPEDLAGASVLIWTTTPWTIPANRAVSFSPAIAYGVYEVTMMPSEEELGFAPWAKPGDRLILADQLAASVQTAAKIGDWKRLRSIEAADLSALSLRHPLADIDELTTFFHFGGRGVPLLAGEHVTDDAGTGFVHTAPGHGVDDYLVWRANGHTDIPDTVGPDGAYYDHVPFFAGLKVLETEGKKTGRDGPANKAVIDKLIAAEALLARAPLTHSYPHSWRSKAPIIFRNTPQWFIPMDQKGEEGQTLREKALAAIDATAFYPEAGRNRMRSMVEGRPDWLVSRQRAWGVPLTLLVHKQTSEVLKDEAVNARILKAVQEKGADVWFDAPAEDFLGPDYDPGQWERVEDILDVWFDSGSTHAFVLEARDDLDPPADLYLEGSDQHRGWFQSSLLESCGTRGRAPYKGVLTHGFLLDEDGRKMSKSLGNSVEPQKVSQQYGAEILRLWVASSDYADDMRIGPEIIKSNVDAYRKLRNTVRYLLGALHGFTEEERLPAAEMPELERYMLHMLKEIGDEVREAFRAYDLKRAFARLFQFCTVDLSAFYFDIRKDALYCDAPDSVRRRAARTVMDETFLALTAWLAPVASFTMEEAWLCRFPDDEGSVHLRQFPDHPEAWRDAALAEKWTSLRKLRRVVTGALEVERREKRIGSSLEAAPRVFVSEPSYLTALKGVDLAEIAITSDSAVEEGEGPAGAFRLEDVPGVAVRPETATAPKCERCWMLLPSVGASPQYPGVCARCADVLARAGAKAAE